MKGEVANGAKKLSVVVGSASDESDEEGFDSILHQLGRFGLWHSWVFFCMSCFAFFSSVSMASFNFMAYPPKYRCYVPKCESDDASFFKDGDFPAYVTLSQDREALEKGTSCEAIPLSSEQCDGTWTGELPPMEPCTKLIFDDSVVDSSIVTTYGLTCGYDWLVPVVGSAFNAGMVFAAPVLGYISDAYGRCTGLLVSSALAAVTGLLAPVMPNVLGFAIMHFFRGAGAFSVYMICFVLLVETMRPNTVMFLSTLLNVVFALGCMTFALEAYLVRDWKDLSLVVSIPFAALCVLYLISPESPRWLISLGHTARAQKAISRAARWNGKDLAVARIKIKPAAPEKVSYRDLFLSSIRTRVLNMCWQWFTVILSFYGLIYASTDLSGDKHMNFVLSFVMEIIAYALLITTVNWIGRRRLLVFWQLANGTSCVVGGLLQGLDSPPAWITTLSTALCMCGKIGASSCFAIVYLYTVELFPTPLRTQTIGVCSTIGRIGGVLAYLIKLLKLIWVPFPTVLIGCFSLTAGICALSLPETVGLPLPETLDEAEALKCQTPTYAKFPRSFNDVFAMSSQR